MPYISEDRHPSLPPHLDHVDGNMYYNAFTAQHEFHREAPRAIAKSGLDKHNMEEQQWEARKDSALAPTERNYIEGTEAARARWDTLIPHSCMMEKGNREPVLLDDAVEMQERLLTEAKEQLFGLVRSTDSGNADVDSASLYSCATAVEIYQQAGNIQPRGYGLPNFIRDLRKDLSDSNSTSDPPDQAPSTTACKRTLTDWLRTPVKIPATAGSTPLARAQTLHSAHHAHLERLLTRRPTRLAELVANAASIKRMARTRNMCSTERLMLLERFDIERGLARNSGCVQLRERLEKLNADLAAFRARPTTFYDLPVELRERIYVEVGLKREGEDRAEQGAELEDVKLAVQGKRTSWNERLRAAFGWQKQEA